MGELGFMFVLALLGGYYYYESLDYKVSRFERTGGAAVFPQTLLLVLGAFIVIRVVQILMSKEKAPFRILTILKGSQGVFFLAFLAYVLLMNALGFIASGSLFMIGVSSYMYHQSTGDKTLGGKKRFVIRSLLMVAAIIILNSVFSTFLNVKIPKGIFENCY